MPLGGVLPASGDLMDQCHAVVHSAMSGAVLAMVRPEMDGSFVCQVREEISLLLQCAVLFHCRSF